MKYGYSGADYSDLIKNYKVVDNKIVISYLDGSVYDMPYTRDNEKLLIEFMLEQAIDRSEATTLFRENCLVLGKSMLALSAVTSVGAMSHFINMSTIDTPTVKACCATAGVGLSIFSLIEGGISWRYFDKVRELEKYDIYLSIRNDIRNASKKRLFEGVKRQEELNINTLDKFSLRDLKRINNNLKSCLDCAYIDSDKARSLKK